MPLRSAWTVPVKHDISLSEALAPFPFQAATWHLPVLKTCIRGSKRQFLSIHVLIRQSGDPALNSKLSKLCLTARKLPHGIFITSPEAEGGLKHSCKFTGDPGALVHSFSQGCSCSGVKLKLSKCKRAETK